MLSVAVRPSMQGSGVGSAGCSHLAAVLRDRGPRIPIAGTSGTGASARTRPFYRMHGSTEEARILDFWAAGDDKIVFGKSLARA